ncbi:MAG: hypothetical protein Q9208_005475 [Pyrenodesmia sp. 3 TL-2023]
MPAANISTLNTGKGKSNSLGKRKALASLDSNTKSKQRKQDPELHTRKSTTNKSSKPKRDSTLTQSRKALTLVDSLESDEVEENLKKRSRSTASTLVDSFESDEEDIGPRRRRRHPTSTPEPAQASETINHSDDDLFVPGPEEEEELVEGGLEDESPEDEAFDEDPLPDGYDHDAEKEQQQAKQLKSWFRLCKENDQYSSMDEEERRHRMKRCREKLEHRYRSFAGTARDIPKTGFGPSLAKDQPMIFNWWAFFLNQSQDLFMDILMDAIPDAVKVILGGPLTDEELLKMPAFDWHEYDLWALYTDLPSKVVNGSEVVVGRYAGSTTAQQGLNSRLVKHERVCAGTLKAEKGKHHDLLIKPGVQANLRVIAVFDQTKIARPHVLMGELLVTSVLDSLRMTPGEYRPPSVIEMFQRAAQEDSPAGKHEPLNSAAQCLQGLYYRRSKEGNVCNNEGCRTTQSYEWHHDRRGALFGPRICDNCHHWRKTHDGQERPASYQASRKLTDELGPVRKRAVVVQRPDAIKALGPKPDPGAICPGCHGQKMEWRVPKQELNRLRWECYTCSRKPTDKLAAAYQPTALRQGVDPEEALRAKLGPGTISEPAASSAALYQSDSRQALGAKPGPGTEGAEPLALGM